MSVQARSMVEVPGVLIEGNQEGSRRREFEVGGQGGGGGPSCVGGREKNNTAETIDGFRLTIVTLGTEPNAPISSDPVLEIHHPIMSKLGGNRGRLNRKR